MSKLPNSNQRGARKRLPVSLYLGASSTGIAAVLVLTAVSAFAAPPPGPIHRDLASLVAASPVIVTGAVTAIKPGRVVGSGGERLAFNDVIFSINRSFKGTEQQSLIVEQVADAEHVVSPEVGPPYRKGERYILFLRPGEGPRYITVAQGRFQLRDGLVRPLDLGPAVDSVAKWDEKRFVETLRQLTQGKP